MAYRLRLGAPLDKSIRKIACEQLDNAISLLQTPDNASTSVHNARKAFKRTRALLRLAKPVLKQKVFKREDKRIAEIARSLSQARDAQVMFEAAAKLELASGGASGQALFAHLRSWLQARQERMEEGLESGKLQTAVKELTESREDMARLPLDNVTLDALLESAQRTYAHGRDAMREALASEDDEICHDWRKLVQRHWRHVRLIQEAWPEEAKARMALAKELAETLGDHHDLCVLRDTVLANGALFARRETARLTALVSERQSELLRHAGNLGEQLYAEKPKALFRRIAVYWETAKQNPDGDASAVALAAA